MFAFGTLGFRSPNKGTCECGTSLRRFKCGTTSGNGKNKVVSGPPEASHSDWTCRHAQLEFCCRPLTAIRATKKATSVLDQICQGAWPWN